MRKYNHVFDISFSLESGCEDASDVTPAMLHAAILKRLTRLSQTPQEILEAAGLCDTYEVTK